MVEAEATDLDHRAGRGRRAGARPRRSSPPGLEAAKPFIRALCEAQQQLADVAAKPTGEFPTYPAYQPDAFEAVAAAATDELAQALTIAGKQEREARLDEVKVARAGEGRRRSSRAARRRSAPRSGR